MMTAAETITNLVSLLGELPAIEPPLNPVYEVLGQYRPLTLRHIQKHSQLLQEQSDLAQEQTFDIHRVMFSCQQLSPTPLSANPLGF